MLAVLALGGSALVGCGERDEPDLETAPAIEAPATSTTERPADGSPAGEDPPPRKPGGPAESAGGDPRVTALEAAAARTVKQFVSALDQRDTERACALLAPGALTELELPEPGGGCAASLAASIGYRDPRGLPVWRSAEVTDLRSVEIDGERPGWWRRSSPSSPIAARPRSRTTSSI